jgi:hypothetical protein
MTAFDGVQSVAGGASRETRVEFGVLLPHASAAAEVPVPSSGRVRIALQFEQTQARSIEAFVRDDFLPVARLTIDEIDYLSAEEPFSRECAFAIDEAEGQLERFPFAIPGGLEADTLFDSAHNVRGRVVRERWPLHGSIGVETHRSGGALAMQIRIANESDLTDGSDRAIALRTAFRSLSLHVSVDKR